MIEYLKGLKQRSIFHGDIKPENVFVRGDQLLVSNPLIYTQFQNGYNMRLSNQSYYAPLPPGLLK